MIADAGPEVKDLIQPFARSSIWENVQERMNVNKYSSGIWISNCKVITNITKSYSLINSE